MRQIFPIAVVSQRARRAAAVLVVVSLAGTARAAAPGTPRFDWLNPTTWPVLPVPNISVDPNSGQTFGLIPTRLQHDAHGRIVRIIAPDIVHNTAFGWGGHVRILDFPSADTQWSIVAGLMQHVESHFDALYESGLMRRRRWSQSVELYYGRNGSARFFGIGNDSPYAQQSVYTDQRMRLRARLGWNLTPAWQLAGVLIVQKVRVSAGHLPGIVSLTDRFPHVAGLGTTHEVLERITLTYNTLDSITLPSRGVAMTLYAGAASRNGAPNASLFSEVGADGRFYWSPRRSLTIAAHFDLRYMPSLAAAPFWALSSVGGDRSTLGGPQPLRGFGEARFYGRNAFSASIELRQKVLTLNTLGTRIALQIAPFYDAGRVFEHSSTVPIDKLHNVLGVGFRGIAAPFIVGYVDVGYGSEGAALFTGINYPF